MMLAKFLVLCPLVSQLVACQQQSPETAADNVEGGVTANIGLAEPRLEPSQVQWHATDWPFGAWRREHLAATQIHTASLQSVSRARRRRRRKAKEGDLQASRGRRRRRRRTTRRRRRRSPAATPAPTPAPTPAAPPAPTPPPAPLTPEDSLAKLCAPIKVASVPSPPPPHCKCQKVCYMYADPHIITFDGASHLLIDERQNHFWAVNTEHVKIQGHAYSTYSYMSGVAAGGPFLGGNKLVAYLKENPPIPGVPRGHEGVSRTMIVTWNGERVLIKTDETFRAEGVELSRISGGAGVPEDSLLRKAGQTLVLNENVRRDIAEMWRTGEVYVFKLPGKVEIFMMHAKRKHSSLYKIHQAAVMIKMPPQEGEHGGWCGNFNGNKADDRKQPALREGDDFFIHSGLSLATMDAAPNLPTTSPQHCEEKTLQVAIEACGHIIEVDIRQACVHDICVGRQLTETAGGFDSAAEVTLEAAAAVEAADEISIMKAIQEDVGAMQECVPDKKN